MHRRRRITASFFDAAGTLATDIANGASSSTLQTNISDVYSVIAAGAVTSATWQQAESTSDHAAATLSADITSSAGSAQI